MSVSNVKRWREGRGDGPLKSTYCTSAENEIRDAGKRSWFGNGAGRLAAGTVIIIPVIRLSLSGAAKTPDRMNNAILRPEGAKAPVIDRSSGESLGLEAETGGLPSPAQTLGCHGNASGCGCNSGSRRQRAALAGKVNATIRRSRERHGQHQHGQNLFIVIPLGYFRVITNPLLLRLRQPPTLMNPPAVGSIQRLL